MTAGLRHGVELHVAAGGQEGEALLDLLAEVLAGAAEQRAETAVEPELLAVVAHEVEDRAQRLARRPAQSSAELLQEEHRAVGGAQQQQRVDHGDVDALVEQVDREHHLHPPVGQVAQRRLALVGGAVGPHRHRGDPHLVEHPGQPGRWAALTQNPSARIVRTSSTPAYTSNTACRARASLAV